VLAVGLGGGEKRKNKAGRNVGAPITPNLPLTIFEHLRAS
jgi:hypothetical protein